MITVVGWFPDPVVNRAREFCESVDVRPDGCTTLLFALDNYHTWVAFERRRDCKQWSHGMALGLRR